jgi:hypothetical protein
MRLCDNAGVYVVREGRMRFASTAAHATAAGVEPVPACDEPTSDPDPTSAHRAAEGETDAPGKFLVTFAKAFFPTCACDPPAGLVPNR